METRKPIWKAAGYVPGPSRLALTVGMTLMCAVLAGCGLWTSVWLANQTLTYRTIHEAAKRGDLADVGRHLARDADVNAEDAYGWTPLDYAADNGHKDVAELLIATRAWSTLPGADVNAMSGQEHKTPLMFAAAAGHKDVVELLIARGARVYAKDIWGSTPLHYAASGGHKDVADLLIAKGADINAMGYHTSTPLYQAASKGIADMVEFLIAKGANVNAKGGFIGVTPLHGAARNGHKDVADLLRRHGGTE